MRQSRISRSNLVSRDRDEVPRSSPATPTADGWPRRSLGRFRISPGRSPDTCSAWGSHPTHKGTAIGITLGGSPPPSRTSIASTLRCVNSPASPLAARLAPSRRSPRRSRRSRRSRRVYLMNVGFFGVLLRRATRRSGPRLPKKPLKKPDFLPVPLRLLRLLRLLRSPSPVAHKRRPGRTGSASRPPQRKSASMGLPGKARARFGLPVPAVGLGERLLGVIALAGLLVGHCQEQPVGSVALAVARIPSSLWPEH
jgi:hypothetical protein